MNTSRGSTMRASASVLVVGCGPAGLAMLQQLRRFDEQLSYACWDEQPLPGGQWTSLKPWSSQYEGMWINGAYSSTVEFHQYPLSRHLGREPPSFFPAPIVGQYLRGYVEEFGLARRIRTGVRVTGVRFDAARSQFAVDSIRVRGVAVSNAHDNSTSGLRRERCSPSHSRLQVHRAHADRAPRHQACPPHAAWRAAAGSQRPRAQRTR